MIWGTWFDPNFKFHAVDDEGVSYDFICFAETESELRKRLEEKGLTVKCIEPYKFMEWKERAERAKDKATKVHLENEQLEKKAHMENEQLEKKSLIPFNDKIWRELKWHLFGLFHGKCAYCESKPEATDYGDVEHFRPKSKVDEDPGHPGYYWLAYDVTNLLPSCTLCNQVHAKMTHFPVEGAHARESKDLDDERPLLLNPYNRQIDPFEHLEFDATGKARARGGSRYGEESRAHYHLNRPALCGARRTAMARAAHDFHVLIGILSHESAYKAFRDDLKLGKREYSAAQIWELERLMKQYEQEARQAES